MKEPWYPFRLIPLYEQRHWAGRLLAEYLGCDPERELPPQGTAVSWELVDDGSLSSTLANGPLAGTTLSDLVREYPRELVGRRHQSGRPFPLCVRVMDVGEQLPLMVHPEKRVATNGNTAEPNHKFWFCLKTTALSNIVAGIGLGVTRMQILSKLNSKSLESFLQAYPARSGDSFFIPSRRLHTIGPGNLVWELLQRPVGHLRVSAWSEGSLSAAEQEEALQHVHFQDRQVSRICREAGAPRQTRRIPLVLHCPEFEIYEIRLRDHLFDRTDGSTFHLLYPVRGNADIASAAGNDVLYQGTLTCLPAALGDYRLSVDNGTCDLLRVCMQVIY